MKSSSIPSIRVEPELRQAAESVLCEGESLSSFMKESLKAGIQHRKAQQEFLARGLTSRAEAKRTGEYFSADVVFDELKAMLLDAEKKAAK